MQALPGNAVLLLIDVQKGFESPQWGKRNNPDAEANMSTLLKLWRQTGRPVVHVRHMSTEPNSPLRPELPGNAFLDAVAPVPGEHVEEKTVNSGFIGTGLESYLRKNGYDTLVIVGLTTNHCVSTTTRMAGNLGFATYLVADATATFERRALDGSMISAESLHAHELASLNGEFATIVTASDITRALATSPACCQCN